jgi:hypothetical protein
MTIFPIIIILGLGTLNGTRFQGAVPTTRGVCSVIERRLPASRPAVCMACRNWEGPGALQGASRQNQDGCRVRPAISYRE